MMMNTKPFKGSNVFMSRKLVPPELFDSLHDALKLNGADVFLCSDPSRNSPNDFHIISSSQHEKFDDLRAKGCNLLGPQCVLSCAKERRALPKAGYVCCLAMDGVKVLASGFETEERAKIEKLVTSMSGMLHSKISSDVSFVIVKHVMAAKYKWAVSKEKHIVTINWLEQCWNEHRIVPMESHRVPPFYGLIICVTRIPADERKEMEKLIVQNGGKYSAELTKQCTHLICEQVPEGDKFKVAQRWGNIRIVTRKWFDQSIIKRACISEDGFAVKTGLMPSVSVVRGKLMSKSGQSMRDSQSVLSSGATVSSFRAGPCGETIDSDLDVPASQNFSSVNPDVSAFVREGAAIPEQPRTDAGLEGCVADDSEPDDNDLYLSDCRIFLVGFDTSDMRKLVGLVRKGGGSRYMSWTERLTHIVVGAPTDLEKRELRGLAALGIIHIVRRNWLEDCDRERKEVPVIQKHFAYELLLPKDVPNRASTTGISSIKQGGCSTLLSSMPIDQTSCVNSGVEISSVGDREEKLDINRYDSSVLDRTKRSSQGEQLCAVNDIDTSQQKTQHSGRSQRGKFSHVFAGKLFCFSPSFPEDRRDEIVQWINEGGGEVMDGAAIMDVDYIVECHGVMPLPCSSSQTIYVSTHWIRSCLEDGCLLDVGSHILYSPLPCQVPIPEFQKFRFCVSQYMDKERLLLRNLCFVLGAKFVEKLTKKVTHLLCKFATGEKYKAACRWGKPTITCEWLYECVRKGGIVERDSFLPKVPEDPESMACNVSQYRTQAEFSVDNSSQFPSQPPDVKKENTKYSSKRRRLSNEGPEFSENNKTNISPTAVDFCRKGKDNGHIVPDVAAAIEDLLEQTSKIQDLKSPSVTECEKNIFSSDCSILSRDHTGSLSAFGPSGHWLSSLGKKEDIQSASKDQSTGLHDGFSETQTESQLVGYEEDLSGRQMIIDRVRTQVA